MNYGRKCPDDDDTEPCVTIVKYRNICELYLSTETYVTCDGFSEAGYGGKRHRWMDDTPHKLNTHEPMLVQHSIHLT